MAKTRCLPECSPGTSPSPLSITDGTRSPRVQLGYGRPALTFQFAAPKINCDSYLLSSVATAQTSVSTGPPSPSCRGRRFKICSYFSLSYSVVNWQQIKLISPSPACFACDSYRWVISLSLSRPTSLSSDFLSPVQLRRGGIGRLGGHLAASQGQPTTHRQRGREGKRMALPVCSRTSLHQPSRAARFPRRYEFPSFSLPRPFFLHSAEHNVLLSVLLGSPHGTARSSLKSTAPDPPSVSRRRWPAAFEGSSGARSPFS